MSSSNPFTGTSFPVSRFDASHSRCGLCDNWLVQPYVCANRDDLARCHVCATCVQRSGTSQVLRNGNQQGEGVSACPRCHATGALAPVVNAWLQMPVCGGWVKAETAALRQHARQCLICCNAFLDESLAEAQVLNTHCAQQSAALDRLMEADEVHEHEVQERENYIDDLEATCGQLNCQLVRLRAERNLYSRRLKRVLLERANRVTSPLHARHSMQPQAVSIECEEAEVEQAAATAADAAHQALIRRARVRAFAMATGVTAPQEAEGEAAIMDLVSSAENSENENEDDAEEARARLNADLALDALSNPRVARRLFAEPEDPDADASA